MTQENQVKEGYPLPLFFLQSIQNIELFCKVFYPNYLEAKYSIKKAYT